MCPSYNPHKLNLQCRYTILSDRPAQRCAPLSISSCSWEGDPGSSNESVLQSLCRAQAHCNLQWLLEEDPCQTERTNLQPHLLHQLEGDSSTALGRSRHWDGHSVQDWRAKADYCWWFYSPKGQPLQNWRNIVTRTGTEELIRFTGTMTYGMGEPKKNRKRKTEREKESKKTRKT